MNGITTTFYPTETLKKKMIEKPVTSYILDDGRDPNPAWDVVARSIWPASVENKTDREALADRLMYSIHKEDGLEYETLIIMSRMAQNLMGNEWMQNWLKNHYFEMRTTRVKKYRKSKVARLLDKLFQ